MKKFNFLDWVASLLVVVGAVNWGLIGFFQYDLVATLFGNMTQISRVIYGAVGIAGVYFLIVLFTKCCCRSCPPS